MFNLIEPENSDGYNPFVYIRKDEDVIKLISNLIQNTTPKNAQQNDPFWEKSEIALDSALMLYLLHEAPPEEQTFEMLMFLIENAATVEDEDESGYQSPVDILFQGLEDEKPEHIAVRQYKIFKQASGKTAKSILISAAVRLAAFNLPEIAKMTSYDNLDIGTLGERKRAIFCVIPDNDNSFNYLVGMLYTQAFQALYFNADNNHGGELPIPVHIVMDEFANVALPDNFERILATMRSRRISVSIIIQNINAAMWNTDVKYGGFSDYTNTMYVRGYEKRTSYCGITRAEFCNMLVFMLDYDGEYVIPKSKEPIIEPEIYGDSKTKNNSETTFNAQSEMICVPEFVRKEFAENDYRLILVSNDDWSELFDNKYSGIYNSQKKAIYIRMGYYSSIPHEFGHYIQSVLPNHNIAADERLKNQLAKLKFTGDDYFMTSDTEFFAEAFAEYCKNGNRLKENCEAVYTYIDNALNTFSSLYQYEP